MTSAAWLEPPPVYSPNNSESLLRGTIFFALLAFVSLCGALLSSYLALTAGGSGAILAVVFLLLLLGNLFVCLIAFRRRVSDMHEGPSYVAAIIKRRRPGPFVIAGQVVIEKTSRDGPSFKGDHWFPVSAGDFSRIRLGDKLRFLRYPHSRVMTSAERYDFDSQRWVPFPMPRSPADVSSGLGWASVDLGSGLVLLLLPLWLLAYFAARVLALRARQRNPSATRGGPRGQN